MKIDNNKGKYDHKDVIEHQDYLDEYVIKLI
jgi:hypothetical protein